MKKFPLTVAILITLGIGIPFNSDLQTNQARAGSPGNIRNFGYYWAGNDPSLFPQVSYLQEVAHYTNFIDLNLVDPYRLDRASQAKQKGLKVLLYVQNCFFYNHGEGWRLNPDWQNIWNNTCRPAIDQIRQRADLYVFDIMDEATGNGLTIQEIETASYALKQAYPQIKTFLTESDLPPTLARWVDIYALTCYAPVSTCQASYNGLKAKHSGEIWVTAQAWSYSQIPPLTVELEQQIWNWVRSDPRFSGIRWFLYADANGTNPPGVLMGTRRFPEIKAYHETIGKGDVLCNNTWENNPVCGVNDVTYQNPDKAKCVNTAIAHYGQCNTLQVLRRRVAQELVQKFNISLDNIPTTPTFADVSQSDPDYRYIEALYREGITAGCATNPLRFCPNDPVTRAQLAVLIVKAWGLPLSEAPSTAIFADVPSNHFAFPYVQIMSRYHLTAGCAINPNLFCPNSLATPNQIEIFLKPILTFTDVPRYHMFYRSVELVSARGIMIGYGGGIFGVNDAMKRRHAAVVLARRFNLPLETPATPTFADVPASDSHYRHVEALYRAGITAGCAINPLKFCPDNQITRAQFMVMLTRALKLDPNLAPQDPIFQDVPLTHPLFKFVQLMGQKGITAGCSVTPNLFCPEDPTTRGQAATFIARTITNFP